MATDTLNDKELLEFAAKAAGIDVHTIEDADGVVHWDGWNPLTDDGDAFRLAVKCGLSIQIGASVFVYDDPDFCDPAYTSVETCESLRNDPYAATRRAIVRAAAQLASASEEIGKNI